MRTLIGTFLLALTAVVSAEIKIDNLDAGEVIRYPVLAVKGRTNAAKTVSVRIEGQPAKNFRVVDGRFAALVELRPGANMLVFTAPGESTRIKVTYRPMTNPQVVKTVWVRAADEGDTYRLRAPGDTGRMKEKLDVAMKLLQSHAAEAMRAAGYGRKTFPLEFDNKGKVVVHIVASPKTGDELRKTDGNPSWSHIYDLLRPRFDESQTRWVVMVGWTGWDPETKKGTGHFALGGGALAAFGSGTMAHWPSSLDAVPSVFDNATPIDPEKEFEDSAGRRTVWANVSTAYGAMIHELGHALGLPHSADSLSFMSRGFDYFNRTFSVIEPKRAGRDEALVFPPDQVCRWGDFFSARLNVSPFFQPDAPLAKGEEPSIIQQGDQLVLRAPLGIQVWGAEADDLPAVFEEIRGGAVKEKTLSLANLRERLKSDKAFRLTVVDVAGTWRTIDIKSAH